MMAGFIQDPIQFVNLIADNLRDRYQTGFPVLKELIQNTDDAPASELHYGLSSGLPGAAHPLLRGPGLFLDELLYYADICRVKKVMQPYLESLVT